MTPAISAVIVSWNSRDHLARALASLSDGGPGLETIVVDNASEDGSALAAREAMPAALIIANEANRGFAAAANQGLRAARAPLALILNPDAELHPGALAAMADRLERGADVAVVGPRTLNADGSVQVSFGPDLTLAGEWRQRRLVRGVRALEPAALAEAARRAATEHEPAWVSGSCLLVRRCALEAVGFFDEGFFLYEEDVDLCLRLRRAGWRIVFTPAAEVVHLLGRSMARVPWRSRLEYQRSHLRFYRKHNGAGPRAVLRALLAAEALACLASANAQRRGYGRALLALAVAG